jgi:tetratricopeptide (TPR) repeat protein
MGEIDSALYYNQFALDIYEKLNEKGSLALCYTNQGNIYEEKKDMVTALEKHLKAKEIVEEDDVRLRLIIETNLADHYLQINEIQKAGKALENLKKNPTESAEAEQEAEIYK